MSPDREQRHALVNELVSMPMAAHRAHYELYRQKGSDAQLDAMADALTGLLDLYALSGDRTSVTPLPRATMRGGRFTGGGGTLEFDDGREPLGDLAVTRASLTEAIQTLRSKAAGAGG